jgi:hypothetical protein
MHPILIILILLLTFWVVRTWGFPLRLRTTGFKYVYVEVDGTVREIAPDEQQYLLKDFHPGDGNRPYIKAHYWQLTPDRKIHGYLNRNRVPWWIEIQSDWTVTPSEFDISRYSNKLTFNNQEDFETHPTSEISCPNCNRPTSINFSDLKKHQLSDLTNLSETQQFEITKISERITELPNSFLDYNCPNCQTGIRIYYESWAGGKHGEHGFELRNIVTA